MSEKKNIFTSEIVGILVAIAFFWYFFGGGLNQQAVENLQQIQNQVADDAVKQYEIAKRNGSAMDIYVQASLVAAAYLQAKDEVNYVKWKAIERREASRAGVSTQ